LKVGVIGNIAKPEAKEAAEKLLHLLSTWEGVSCVLPESYHTSDAKLPVTYTDSALDTARQSDIVFSLGGDGTMLTAARCIIGANPEAELIGVNLGRLGFLAENPPEELAALIDELRESSLNIEERCLLTSYVRSESSPKGGLSIRRNILEPRREKEICDDIHLVALNEVVVDNFGSTRMLTLEITVDGALLGTMRADGLIVATPTGSTGYAVSAGGPIIEPTSPVFVITAIAPHSLTARPIIVPDTCEISVRITNDAASPILVVADGQEEIIAESPAIVTLSKFDKKLRLLRRSSTSYFDLLRTKLLWSADAREQGKGRW
jgi:NAD+ kinase